MAIVALLCALALLIAATGAHTALLLAVMIAQLVAVGLGAWLFIAHRGALRWVGAVLAVGAALSVFAVPIVYNLLWAVLVAAALVAVAWLAARRSVTPPAALERTDGATCPPPRRPFLIMNPKSGGGKVGRFGLDAKAKRLGAQVALLDPSAPSDVAALARRAIDEGADLVGVAGGDGTQALVAAVAAERHVPFLVIPAGTRNHFALDLGLDREDPAKSLDALVDGVEMTVDLGDVAGRPFVNNVSFGAYAEIVKRPDYRDDKRRVTLDVLPDLLSGQQATGLTVRAGSTVVHDPQAALISNNPYALGDIAGMGQRPRLDGGVLGLVTVRVDDAGEALALLRGRHADGLTIAADDTVTVESESTTLPAGVDGEIVMLPPRVTCRVHAGALRVRVPRQRASRPPLATPVTLRALLHNARPARPANHPPADR